MKIILAATYGVFSLFAVQIAFAAETVQRASPDNGLFTAYTARAVATVLVVGILVTILLGAGMLVLNLGLMSKRREDHIGHRDPSDVGILKGTVWPAESDDRRYLPAEEDEDDPTLASPPPRDPVQSDVGQERVNVDSPYFEGGPVKKAS